MTLPVRCHFTRIGDLHYQAVAYVRWHGHRHYAFLCGDCLQQHIEMGVIGRVYDLRRGLSEMEKLSVHPEELRHHGPRRTEALA